MVSEKSTIVKWVTEDEISSIKTILNKLLKDTKATKILLVDRFSNLISSATDHNQADTDTTEKYLEQKRIKEIIAEQGYYVSAGGGACLKNSLYISLVSKCFVLIVVWYNASSLGLVRKGVKDNSTILQQTTNSLIERLSFMDSVLNGSFREITDEDLDNLTTLEDLLM